MSYLPELFESRDYATAIKVLDDGSSELIGAELASTKCNRGLCYQRMDLHRKALKNYEDALAAVPTFSRAHMGRGVALQALGRPKEAQRAWQDAIENFCPLDDLGMIEKAYQFIQNLSPSPEARKVHPNSASQSQPKPLQPPAAPKAKQPALDISMAVGLAVSHINQNQIDKAISLLDQAISQGTAPNMGAFIARGTARALKRDLEGAIEDFTESIRIYPSYGDAWKRRGQARSAHGDREGALADFQKALELIAEKPAQAEIRAEAAQIYKQQRDLRRAVKELEVSLALEAKSASTWTQLGLCKTGLGDIEEGCAAYARAAEIEPNTLDIWFNLAQARKEAAHVAEAEAGFRKVFALLKGGSKDSYIRRVYSHMKQGLGQHLEAVQVLSTALESAEGASKAECFYLRGACYHALGFHKEAIDDYSKAFVAHGEDFQEETQQQQVMAFFQRELALHAFNNLDKPVEEVSLDHDIHPVFKELWCKKVPPSPEQLKLCHLQLPEIPSDVERGPPPPKLRSAEYVDLMRAADRLGELLQNRHQGFLPNARQQRMGGLAAIQLAQAVRHLIAARRKGERVVVEKGASGGLQPHAFGWRDALDIVVKWRQLSEPNDQVIWVDLLTRSQFEEGFGSHTPMFSGQTKCVRYFMNFPRALKLLKEIVLKEGWAYNASQQKIPLGGEAKQQAVSHALTAEEMWAAIGEDSWAVVPIQSTLHPDLSLEGTRLIVVKDTKHPSAYEVSIRTPVTPPRWKQFDEELSGLWETLLDVLMAEEKPKIAKVALTFVYYWYNFMPLARGTAVCGHITLLALFLAADMPITAKIPKDFQVDWEAILQRRPEEFIALVSPWLLPPDAKATPQGTSQEQVRSRSAPRPPKLPRNSPVRGPAVEDLDDAVQDLPPGAEVAASLREQDQMRKEFALLPPLKSFIPTLRNRLEILNGPTIPQI